MKFFSLSFLALTALLNPAFGEPASASKQEIVGVSAGSVIGGLAGGPFGFVVGAGFGGWLGDRMHQGERAETQLRTELADTRTSEARLNRELTAARQEFTVEVNRHRSEQDRWTQALAESINLSVLFRTGDSRLSSQDEERLDRLAKLLSELPPSVIHIEGHADPRGDEEYNAQLSAERATIVRDALVRGGIDPGKISVAAYGEELSPDEDGDLDRYAMDRRVDIYLTLDDVDRLAQRH